MATSESVGGIRLAGDEKVDLPTQLNNLENGLEDLRLRYEQFFSGIVPLAPDGLHSELKSQLRALKKAPFRSSAINFRLKAIESKYQSYQSYWKRVLREKEEGTYAKDVFKANLRERLALEDARASTSAGIAEKGMQQLFQAYVGALEKQKGAKVDISFEAFKKSLMARAKTFKEKSGATSLSFSIVLKSGQVTIQAKPKPTLEKEAGKIKALSTE
jgi:hypothetical protein